MHSSKLWTAASIAALLFLAVSDLALAQPLNVKRMIINPSQILTIRMFYHPAITPPQPVMEIFLKDPGKPGFLLRGENGRVLESFHRMQELAMMFKKQKFTVLYEPTHGYVTETNHPYFVKGANYSKKMYIILGFYGIGYPEQGPVPTGGQQGNIKMMPGQSMSEGPPAGEPMRGRMMHEPPPPEQIGFCCIHGNVVEAPAHACQMEGGAFYRDAEAAQRNCRAGGER